MNSLFVSRFVHNSIWLALALTCILVSEKFLFAGIVTLSVQELLILSAVMLSSGIAIDVLTPKAPQVGVLLRHSLLLVLATSLILFTVSQVHGLFMPDSYAVLGAILLFALFRGLDFVFAGQWTYPQWLSSRILLLGNGTSADTIRRLINDSRGRYTLCGSMSIDNAMEERGEDGSNSKLLELARRTGANTLVVSFPERRGIMPMKDILQCRLQGIHVVDAHTFYERATRKLYIENMTPSCIIFSSGFCLSPVMRFVKRSMNIVGALVGLCLLAPLFPIIALAVRLDSPGPVFFRQIRTGLGGKPFSIIKFRTMREDAEKDTGAVWATKHDPRITRLGSFLRKTRLDEIPQLLNVLRGDMNLVGPRPERPEFIKELEKAIPFYSERHCVPPGLTGWAQVRYPYGSSVEDALEKLRYDLYYIKKQSLWLEFEIILRTILVIFSGSGAR